MKRILLALQFLTIIPIRVPGDVTEREMAQSAAFFPLAGAIQGLLAALAAFLFMKIFPPEITGGMLLLVLILCNGGFDLDGLADTADALAVKSTGNAQLDREKRLGVMKDSATGAMGVIALVMALLLKFLFLHRLLQDHSPFTSCSMVFLMPVFSKWVTVPAMYHGTPARKDGLGRIFLDNMKINTVVLASLVVAVLYIAVAELHLLKVYGPESVTLLLVIFALLYLFGLLSARFLAGKFGGLTGDHFGAMSEISEILFLMVVTVWLRR